jgi:hypothetical protein
MNPSLGAPKELSDFAIREASFLDVLIEKAAVRGRSH